jgi:hypothetical protein
MAHAAHHTAMSTNTARIHRVATVILSMIVATPGFAQSIPRAPQTPTAFRAITDAVHRGIDGRRVHHR